MYVWRVIAEWKELELIPFNPCEVSDPYISAERAIQDYNWLEWSHVNTTKFSGTVLDFWEAENDKFSFLIKKEHVIGSDDE